jgi:ACS family tartrate transporter-like MFS transporter
MIVLRGTAAAAGIALVNGLGNLGGFAGPYAVGLSKTSTGSTGPAFMALAVASLVTAGLMLLLRRQPGFRSLQPLAVAPSGATG